jgi:hypothetical protein
MARGGDGNATHADLRIRATASRAKTAITRRPTQANDQLLDDLVIWSDNSPERERIELAPTTPGKEMTVRIWNAWRDAAGTMQAWIGDTGVVVDVLDPEHVVLRCSDGSPPPLFTDLVIDLAAVLNQERTTS